MYVVFFYTIDIVYALVYAVCGAVTFMPQCNGLSNLSSDAYGE